MLYYTYIKFKHLWNMHMHRFFFNKAYYRLYFLSTYLVYLVQCSGITRRPKMPWWNVHVINQKRPESKGKFSRNSFCTSQKSLESHGDILIGVFLSLCSSRMRAAEHHCLHYSAVCLITRACWDTLVLVCIARENDLCVKSKTIQ